MPDESTGNTNQGDAKITFSPEQQKVLNSIVDTKFGEGFTKAERLANEKIAAMQAEMAELKKKLETPPPDEDADKGKRRKQDADDRAHLDEALKPHLDGFKKQIGDLSGRVEERERQIAILAEQRKRDLLTNLANKNGAFKPDTVALLLEGKVEVNPATGDVSVKPVNGQTPIDAATGKTLTVDLLVENYMKEPENAYLLRVAASGGAGTNRSGTANADNIQTPPVVTAEQLRTGAVQFQKLTPEQRKAALNEFKSENRIIGRTRIVGSK